MSDRDDLIQQLEDALDALKAGQADAHAQLTAVIRSIEARDGGNVILGNNNRVTQTINNYGYTVDKVNHLLHRRSPSQNVDPHVPNHCMAVAERLSELPWCETYYIQERAKILPMNASPYEDGVVRGQPQNVLHRLWNSQRLIILGEPGLGKTVALERLAWELATHDEPIIPIFIKLLAYDGQPLLEWARLDLVSTNKLRIDTIDQTRDFLRATKYGVYFLLDGLNEVPPAHRQTVIGEITRLAMEFPQHAIAVTSRIQDESWAQLRQRSQLQDSVVVQPIEPDQAYAYLVAHLGEDDAAALWLGMGEHMQQLATTPLLLMLIKETWRGQRERDPRGDIRVPDNRGELYTAFVKHMLRRDTERGLGTQVTEREQITALEQLALTLHERQALTIDVGEANTLAGEDTIKSLRVNGFLIGEQTLRFAPHQTMQEHFAARALEDEVMKEVAQEGPLAWFRKWGWRKTVLDHAKDPWWAETFVQLAGLTSDPNALARTIAEVDPFLAWWCVQDGRPVDDATRQEIENSSIRLVQSNDVRERRQAAQALAGLQTPLALEPLGQLSLDPDPTTSRVALIALFNLGPQGEEIFSHQLSAMPIKDRVEWGQRIADIDPRPGVGLNSDGLPDIAWVDVPAAEKWTMVDHRDYQVWTGAINAFRMSRYPVTYAQYRTFIEAEDGFSNPRWWQGLDAPYDNRSQHGDQNWKLDNHPAENVSWWDAQAYCAWLSAQLGHPTLYEWLKESDDHTWQNYPGIRLPTEWEWQWAAQGDTGWAYPYEGDYDPSKANTSDTGIGQTSAVGIFPQGAARHWGDAPDTMLMDLSGNVWEWCLNEYDTPENTALGGQSRRVVRGGSFVSGVNYTRAVDRDGGLPDVRVRYDGFRVVAAPP